MLCSGHPQSSLQQNNEEPRGKDRMLTFKREIKTASVHLAKK